MNDALSKPKTLAEWADMGRKFNQPIKIPDWDSIKPFIISCQKFLEHLKKETETLLEESGRRLSPFQDPFCIDFSSNRWFAGGREEGYSDWLAWIIEQLIEQLEGHRLVFELLDIPDDEIMLENCEGITTTVSREERVDKGHDGQEGRLDIVIRRYQSKLLILLIHIEVKVVSAEDPNANLGKNAEYEKALKKEGGQQYHRLLVTKAENKPDYGYEALYWADICIKLRNMVSQIEQPLVASLALSFAGAVEQNLLGLSTNINAAYFDSRTFDYIKRFVEGGHNYDKK